MLIIIKKENFLNTNKCIYHLLLLSNSFYRMWQKFCDIFYSASGIPFRLFFFWKVQVKRKIFNIDEFFTLIHFMGCYGHQFSSYCSFLSRQDEYNKCNYSKTSYSGHFLVLDKKQKMTATANDQFWKKSSDLFYLHLVRLIVVIYGFWNEIKLYVNYWNFNWQNASHMFYYDQVATQLCVTVSQ